MASVLPYEKSLARSFCGPGEADGSCLRVALNRIPLPFRYGRRTDPVIATGPRPGAGGSAVAPAKRVPERTSGSAAARRGISPERELSSCLRAAGTRLSTRFPESESLIPFPKRPAALWRGVGRLARDRGSPFAVTATGRPSVQGDSFRRIWRHKTRWLKPPVRVRPWRYRLQLFTVPTISRRNYRPRGRTGRASPGGGGRAPALAAAGRPPSKGDSFRRIWAFLAHRIDLRLQVSCALSNPGPLHPTRLRRSFSAVLAVPLRFSWRSDMSFRLCGYDVRRILPSLRGDSLRRVWEMAFVAAFPPARVRPHIRGCR